MKKIFVISLAFVFVFSLGILVQASEIEGTINPGLVTGMEGVVIAAPTASPVAGTYHATQTVSLTAAGSTKICYTTVAGGDDPVCASSITCTTGTALANAGTISITSTKTVKSVACYADNSTGPMSTDTYTLTCSTSSVTNGTVSAYPTCAITCNSGYTLSGSTCEASGGGGGGGGGTPSTPTAVSGSNVPLSVLTTQSGTLTQTFTDSSVAKVEIPKGALTKTTTFSAAQGSLTGGLTPTDTMGAILIGNTVFNISAKDSSNQSVTDFASDLSITLTIPDLADISDLGVYYFDRTLDQWVSITGVEFDFVNNKVSFDVDHLTRFAVFQIAGLPGTIDTEEGLIMEDSFWTLGRWVKKASITAVYFLDSSDVLHTYPNQSIWESYFGDDFSFVETISEEELNNYTLGVNVPYASGSLFKMQAFPKVYMVGENGLIQWIKTEEKAVELYGDNWASLVHDLSTAFFMDYTRGADIE